MKLFPLLAAAASCAALAQQPPAEQIPPGSPPFGLSPASTLSAPTSRVPRYDQSTEAAPATGPGTVPTVHSRTTMGAGPLVETETDQRVEPTPLRKPPTGLTRTQREELGGPN